MTSARSTRLTRPSHRPDPRRGSVSISHRTRHRRLAVLAVPMTAVLVSACGNGSDGAASGGDGGEDVTITGISQELIDAAAEEGEVVIYGGGHQRDSLELLQQQMQDLFGVQLTFTREDSGSTANAVSAELASGNLNADVVSLTDPGTMADWAEQGVITDAEVPNLDDIVEGLDDPDSPQVPYSLIPLGIMYNSANTDPADLPTTWEELASDDFGALISADPNASGTARAFYTMMDALHGEEWLEQLAGQNVTVTDSSLALAQLVLTGEQDIGIPAIESAVLSAAAEGEPLEIAYMEDGVPTFPTEIAMLADAPHPNAAQLLVQYHLSPEFQADLVELGGRSALEGADQPEGAGDLSDATLLTASLEDISGRGSEVAELFSQLFNR
jgi:iron(III) transport system substrate-binding protein